MFLQTYPGRFLAARLTWLSVVVGIGVDMAIVAVFVSWPAAIAVMVVVGVSAVPIIIRSLINDMRDQRVVNHGHTDKTSK